MAQEVRMFSGKTLSKDAKRVSDSGYREIYEYLMEYNREVVNNYRAYSRRSFVPSVKKALQGIIRSVGQKYEKGAERLGGVLASATSPLKRLITILFTRSVLWQGQPQMFYKALVDVVLFSYRATLDALRDNPNAEAVARSTARIFCNFLLSTRLTYEASRISDDDIAAALEATSQTPLGREAQEIEEAELGPDVPDSAEVKAMAAKLRAIFMKMRLMQYVNINPINFRFIAYAFVVNATGTDDVNVLWYGKGTRAYTDIIKAITDSAIAGVMTTGAFSKVHGYYDDEYEYPEDDMVEYDEVGEDIDEMNEEMDELFEQDDDVYDEDEYTYEDDEDAYMEEDEMLYQEEPLIGLEDEGDVEETGITLAEESGDDETLEALMNLEPSERSYSIARKFLSTRHFSNTLDFKRRFYEYLINEFVGNRSYAKNDDEIKEAIAELVDKVDVLADKIDDLPGAVAKVVEGAEAISSEDEEDKDVELENKSWEDFWKAGDEETSESEEEEEKEEEVSEEEEEVEDEETDEERAESRWALDEDEDHESSFYARLKHYKKRMAKKSSRPARRMTKAVRKLKRT